MPIYEYDCGHCGHELEVIQKMSDEPLAFCPECGKETLKKKLSAAAFQLKGSGWYETDFKGGSKKAENKAETKVASTDAKPAAKKHSCGGGCAH